jgi:hypothetical protein
MKKIGILYFLLVIPHFLMAQDYCTTSRYDSTVVFSLASLDADTVIYGNNDDWMGNPVDLNLFIVFPKLSVDTAQKRPTIILVHGGGFTTGSYFMPDMQYFSQRGYVTASVDYRLGLDTLCYSGNTTTIDAVYRAIQDQQAAIRYLVNNAATYKIDTNYLFLFGRSAGAVTNTTGMYTSEAIFESIKPGIGATLGPLDASTNALTNTYSIKAMSNVSGSIGDTSLISLPNSVPMAMFHGVNDLVVPYGYGHPHNCSFITETEGSSLIQQRLQHIGQCYAFYSDTDAGHADVYSGDVNFIRLKTMQFFKRVFCQECYQTIFSDLTEVQDNLVSTGIENPDMSTFSFTCFPNPAHDFIQVDIPDKVSSFSITVYNLLGEEIISRNNEKLIDLRILQAGIYYVVFNDGTTKRILKLLKE